MNALLVALEFAVLLYFVVINTVYALSLYVAARQLARQARQGERLGLTELLERDYYQPISILVPAYNEQETITASVMSFLRLHFPEFEVIVVNDGSHDDTLAQLRAAFALTASERTAPLVTPHQTVRGVYRSLTEPRLLVLDKLNGGKADALNAALNYARFPLFCAVDADSLLDAEALLRVARQFVEDDHLVALGGTIRVLNGATLRHGRVVKLQMPRRLLERLQVVEYTRAFLNGRTTFSALGGLLVISGAFGMFRRSAAVAVGGYRRDTVGEDMELVVRLHRWHRERRLPYAVRYSIDPICWTQVPDSWKILRKQRDRWHRGLWETLWTHRKMLLNARYGRVGLLVVPYYWLFEALSPVIEVGGYALLAYLIVTGQVNTPFALAFMALALLYGMVVGVGAFGVELFMHTRYERKRDRVTLLLTIVAENFGYRQALAVVRLIACAQVWRKRGQWGAMTRRRIDQNRTS